MPEMSGSKLGVRLGVRPNLKKDDDKVTFLPTSFSKLTFLLFFSTPRCVDEKCRCLYEHCGGSPSGRELGMCTENMDG